MNARNILDGFGTFDASKVRLPFTLPSLAASLSKAQAFSIAASGETGMRNIFMYTGWRVKWLAGG